MITISARALDWLSSIDTPRMRVLRLEPRGVRRLGLTFGRAQPGDQVIETDGRVVVHVDRLVSQALDGTTLGVSGHGLERRLVLIPKGAEQP